MSKTGDGKRLLGGLFLLLSLLASFMTLIALACAADITIPLFFCTFIGCLLSGIGLLRLKKWGTYSAIVTSGLILVALFTLIFKSMSYVGVDAPKFSPDGQNLILGIRAGREGGIYKIKLSDKIFQRLTFPSTKANEMNPAYSPDGSKIVFSRYQGDGGHTHLFLMDADGANLIQLTQGSCFDINPKFSRDGKKIYFIRTEDSKRGIWSTEAIYSIALDGFIIQRITSPGIYNYSGGISVSPDDGSLLVSANKNGEPVDGWMAPMRIIRINNNEVSEILIKPDIKQFHPDNTIPGSSGIRGAEFSPDGETILFSGYLKLKNLKGSWLNDSQHSIYKFDYTTKQVKKIIDTDSYFGEGPNISPDGQKIAFCTGSSYSCDKIYIANTNGSDLNEIEVKLK